MIPTDQEIESLHLKYAKNETDFALIYGHCRVIEAIAMQLLDAKPSIVVDRELVRVGSLLHDIGAYSVISDEGRFVQGVRHGVFGEAILKEESFPEDIWRFASHHTGVGLTEQDVQDQNLPIPVADYTARTDEERLIMYADKFHSKSHPPAEPPYFCTFEWYRDSVKQFGEGSTAKFDALADLFGKPDVTALSREFNQVIKGI